MSRRLERINAPFTPEQVEFLNQYQESGRFHPFTCCSGDETTQSCKRRKASDGRANGEIVPYNKENEGVLIASESGWVCPCGESTQDWAYAFMAGPLPPDPLENFRNPVTE